MRTDGLRLESAPVTVKASGKYTGVIEDHQIIGPQKLRKIPKLQVSHTAIAAIEVKEMGSGTVRQRLLGDLILGQIVMELGHKHAIDYRGTGSRAPEIAVELGQHQEASKKRCTRLGMGLSGARKVLYDKPVRPPCSPATFPMVHERQIREQIVRYGRMLHERGFVAATDGNLSVRLSENRILSTPTCMSKGRMRTSDLVIVDMEGRLLSGKRKVSSEIGMHLLIYRLRPDVKGIVHAHPPTATGFAAAGVALNQPLVCEVVIGLGSIPLAKYGTPGTAELTDALQPLVPGFDAILMSNHGVVAYGTDLEQAYMKMETVEHFARIALVTHQLGHQEPLGPTELEKLVVVRAKYMNGAQTTLNQASGNGHGRKKSAETEPASELPRRGV